MTIKLTPYEQAGRIFRILGWIQLVAGILIAFAVVIPYFNDAKMRQHAPSIFILVLAISVILGLAIFQLYLGKAIKEHKNWSRTLGIIFAVIQLAGFPIGTLLGGYILWCLIKGWNPRPVE